MTDADRVVILSTALTGIIAWAKAYPLEVFPEPDLGKVHRVLAENGMTLDAISAHAMRHVINEVAALAQGALDVAGGEP